MKGTLEGSLRVSASGKMMLEMGGDEHLNSRRHSPFGTA